MTNKSQKILRADMQKVLANMDERWVEGASSRIVKNLEDLVVEEIHKKNHVDALLAWNPLNFSAAYPGLPRVDDFLLNINDFPVYVPQAFSKKVKSLDFCRLEGRDDNGELFRLGSRLVDEPGNRLLLMIPALAFDSVGNRLGFGDNLFQLFLQNLSCKNVEIVGVAWSLQLVNNFSERSEDLVVDWLCTEEQYRRTILE